MQKDLIESEKTIERKLKTEIEKIGGLTIKLLSTHLTGLPDRLCLLPGGRLFFIELKTTNQKPKKIQLWWHRKLQDLGFQVLVIDTSEKIKQFITSL